MVGNRNSHPQPFTIRSILPVKTIEITDLNDPRVEMFTHLTEAQLRNKLDPEQGIFIAESPKVINVALDAGMEPVALLTSHKNLDGQAQPIVARCGDIPIYTGDDALLTGITGFELTRGILCAMRRAKPLSVPEVCEGKHRIVIIDSVVNATNTGAIFRAAAALGMDGILLTRTCCDPLNRRSVRVSMGTVFQIPWTYLGETCHDWPQPSMEQLHQLGYKTAAMALSDNSICIDDPRLRSTDRLAIIMGNEGDGLSNEALEACDYIVKIPMQNGVDSLNVAGAAAVAFWEMRSRE